MHQGINGLPGRLHDINHAFVGANLIVLLGILVRVRRSEYRKALFVGRHRDWTDDLCPCRDSGIDDLFGCIIHDSVVKGFESDADTWFVICFAWCHMQKTLVKEQEK